MTNWIYCKDRNPEKDGRYLVAEIMRPGFSWVGIMSLRNGEWDSKSVVAWQNLPELPEFN